MDSKSGGGSYYCRVKKLIEIEVRKKMIVQDYVMRRGQAEQLKAKSDSKNERDVPETCNVEQNPWK